MDSDPLSLGSKPLHHVSLEESTDGAQSPGRTLRRVTVHERNERSAYVRRLDGYSKRWRKHIPEEEQNIVNTNAAARMPSAGLRQ